jgi:ferredoxin
MATMITSECINCGACEPECPNTAIYQGGVEWELNGVKHPALAQDVFYIVPQKCTECVGFHDQEACAAVCPVDVCIPNPDIPETEDVLIARARELHPGTDFPPDFPSRFREGSGAPAPAAAAAAPAPSPAPAPAAAAPAAATPAAKPAASASTRVEKPLNAPPPAETLPPRPEKRFPGELQMSFADATALLEREQAAGVTPTKWLLALGQPVLGALPFRQKKAIEQAVGDRRFFTAASATGINALHNMILYPLVFLLVGWLLLDRDLFTDQLKWLVFLGMVLGAAEAIWRMREGLRGVPADQVVYRAAVYGLPLGPVAAPIAGLVRSRDQRGGVGHDGFRDRRFEERLERERRYGEVYRLHAESNGYLLEVEFPRQVPASKIKEELGVPDEMPDYDYELALQNGHFVVKGKLTDPNMRRVAAVSSAFPPDFTTTIKLPSRVAGFRHRFNDKTLEVALPKKL